MESASPKHLRKERTMRTRVDASKNARRDDRILITKFVPIGGSLVDRRAWSLQFFVHSPIGNSTNTSQPGPATRA